MKTKQEHPLLRPRDLRSSSVRFWLLAGLLSGCATQQPRGSTAEPALAAAPEVSVKPGINTDFLASSLDVDAMVQRFEVESREICAERAAIVAQVGLQPGERIADIGAGTGLFLEPFAEAVGPTGRLFAVDIAEPFVEHMAQRARAGGWTQVAARRCSERSVELPEASIDVAFVCDTYHHFEYPHSTLASIHRALRPGGRLVLVDFERIPGVTREWLLGHVRAGKGEVLEELQAAGFELLREPQLPGLTENYCLVLERR